MALEIHNNQPGAHVMTIICDGGEQYFDTLFEV